LRGYWFGTKNRERRLAKFPIIRRTVPDHRKNFPVKASRELPKKWPQNSSFSPPSRPRSERNYKNPC